jgi:hypothetical protein
MGEANGPGLKTLGGVTGLVSFSSFSCGGSTREAKCVCLTGVRESSRETTGRLSIPLRGFDGREKVRSWKAEMGYRRGRRVGERGGKREGLRIERNSSSASEGKVDLGDARGEDFGDKESGSKWSSSKGSTRRE